MEPASPEKARTATRWFLGNCPGVSTGAIDTAVLLVSELATNAYSAMTAHSATAGTADGISRIGLSLRLFGSRRLLIEVTDSSPRVPLLAAGGPDAVSGRGLMLVDGLSRQWGYFWHHDRKVVYAVLSVTAGAGTRPTGGSPEYAQLDDPAFLDERARLRERLMHEPENAIGRPELERVYAAMTEEFLRRAHIAWTTSM